MADVAIGAPASGGGSVFVFDGSETFGYLSTPDVLLSGGDQFGRAVAAAGDINGDGFVDLAVAAGAGPGTVTVYLGGPGGLSWIGSFTGIPEHERAYFGGPGSSSTGFSAITIPGHGNKSDGAPGAPIAFSYPTFTGGVGFGSGLPTLLGTVLPIAQ